MLKSEAMQVASKQKLLNTDDADATDARGSFSFALSALIRSIRVIRVQKMVERFSEDYSEFEKSIAYCRHGPCQLSKPKNLKSIRIPMIA